MSQDVSFSQWILSKVQDRYAEPISSLGTESLFIEWLFLIYAAVYFLCEC